MKIAATAELKLVSMAGLIDQMTGTIASARALKSQAESTLDTYQGKTKGRGRYMSKWVYFGWGNEYHVFSRGKIIFCPKANDSDIKAKDDAKFKDISDGANIKLTKP